MNRSEISEKVAGQTDLSASKADAALAAAFDAIVAAVASGEKVTIAGFGTFEPRERSARTGRNPQTGEEMQIAATTVPGFKAGAPFKRAVSGS
jgi:DNA-binding protein HU-beta